MASRDSRKAATCTSICNNRTSSSLYTWSWFLKGLSSDGVGVAKGSFTVYFRRHGRELVSQEPAISFLTEKFGVRG